MPAKGKYLSFYRARAVVRKLGLRTQKEWRQWSKSGARPNNIPSSPDQVYRDAGWISWPDWLGYEPRQGGQHAGVSFLPFNRARAAVRKLGLRSQKEWEQWSKSGARSNNIPSNPDTVYRDAGWISWPDWLGYEPRQGGQNAGVSFLPFNTARAAVRKLGLRSAREWQQRSKSDARPNNIPGDPYKVYRDAGWISWPDWLGYEPRQGGPKAGVSFLPFNRARAAVRKLGLRTAKEWKQWSKSGARPNNIPGTPHKVYRDAGWISLPDWLGYEPHQGRHTGVSFLPFNRARAAVRKLGLRSAKEWKQWRKSGARPNNIPGNPDTVYRDAGWISWPDWLGYEPRQGGQHAGVLFLPFNTARAAVRKLGLRSGKEWNQWSKSDARPNNIPSTPDKVYRDAGWISMPDWLGYEPRHGGQQAGVSFLPFNRARAAMRKLRLKSAKEWHQWSKSGARPNNIPSSPQQVYRNAGWISYPDWLGYERTTRNPSTRGTKRKRAAASSTPAPPPPQPAAEVAEAPPSDDDDYDNDCPVCFEPIPDAERVRLRCSHWFCAACVRNLAKTAVAAAQEEEEGGGGGNHRASRLGVMVSCPMCRARVRVATAE